MVIEQLSLITKWSAVWQKQQDSFACSSGIGQPSHPLNKVFIVHIHYMNSTSTDSGQTGQMLRQILVYVVINYNSA